MDASGNLTSTRSYDVCGAGRAGTGTATSKHGFVRHLGHETEDAADGLITMRARWYNPGAGRFISEDPGRNSGKCVCSLSGG
jgi:RHS repeat-associated protein